jgi:hypothetical protein
MIPGTKTRSVGATVFKRLNRDGRGTHRNDRSIAPAHKGDREINPLALARTACGQEHPENPDACDDMGAIVFHIVLLRIMHT